MQKPIPRALNLNNLKYVFQRIQHLEAFIYFGTLLGYTREGNIIAHDDDIDIYVNARDREELQTIFANSGDDLKFRPSPQRSPTPYFAQLIRVQEGQKTFSDFYLYDDSLDEHIVDKWNFSGKKCLPRDALHTPKDLIFPLQETTMQGIKIRIPAKPEAVCEFLYGPTWKIPALKKTEYEIKIRGHKPVFVKIDSNKESSETD